MSFPKVIALDTDWTIWKGFLDHTKWGKGRGAYPLVEDNIEHVGSWMLRDRTNLLNSIHVYRDISKVVNDILRNGAKLAIVSRNPSKAMCDRALYYFKTTNPASGKEESIIHLVQYDEVIDESKVQHFRRIRTWSASDFSEMLLFDDEAFNNVVRVELGMSFQLVRDGQGLTWATYQQGLDAWRRAKAVSIIPNPSEDKRILIGYSGLSTRLINLFEDGEGLVDPTTPARWGYALYVADTIGLAKFFCDWDRRDWGRDSYVCEVWVRDYEAWTKVQKIWVPEHDGRIPQMNNMNWTAEQSGRNQEDRDRFIAQHWGVKTPYVLFSMHHWMHGMPIPENQRWSEMVVYTQIQRVLFDVKKLLDAEVAEHPNPNPCPFYHQVRTWNIVVPKETQQEFQRYGDHQSPPSNSAPNEKA